MRTTLDIDRELLERARAVPGPQSFKEAVDRALEQACGRRSCGV